MPTKMSDAELRQFYLLKWYDRIEESYNVDLFGIRENKIETTIPATNERIEKKGENKNWFELHTE